MKKLVFTAKNGKKITFDDFVVDSEYDSVWCGICEECAGEYREELYGHLDNCGSGCCSVDGCGKIANYYVDFRHDDNIEVTEE